MTHGCTERNNTYSHFRSHSIFRDEICTANRHTHQKYNRTLWKHAHTHVVCEWKANLFCWILEPHIPSLKVMSFCSFLMTSRSVNSTGGIRKNNCKKTTQPHCPVRMMNLAHSSTLSFFQTLPNKSDG